MIAAETVELATTDELCERLGVSRRQIAKWLKRGMPVVGKTKDRRYNVDAVESWLIENGHAEIDGPEQQAAGKICRTYSELARELAMESKAPERLIAYWLTIPGFPGRAGKPGRQEAYLPVDEIREWLEARDRGVFGSNGGRVNDDEFRRLDKQRRQLQVEIESRKLQESLGHLADVEEVARFNRRCVANAVAILEPLADDVLMVLPTELGPGSRREVHAAVTKLLDNARLAIAEIIEGDKDETEEPEE